MRAIYAIVIVTSATFGMCAATLWVARGWHRPPTTRLSVFEPDAGGCAWYRLDISRGDEQQMARFPSDCATVQAAWAPSAKEAVVWFSLAGFPSREDMLFQVELPTQKPKRLPLPEPGEALTYLYDDAGRIHAFTEDQQVAAEPAAAASGETEDGDSSTATDEPGWLVAQGHRYRASRFPEGQDVLVRSLILGPDGWQVEEVAASRCCVEGAPGLHALQIYARLTASDDWRKRQSNAQLTTLDALQPTEPAPLLQGQAQRLPDGIDPTAGPWLRLASPAWPRSLLVRGTTTEPSHATGVAFFAEAGHARAIPSFTFGRTDVLQLMDRDAFLLITDWATGMDPHLYDMRTGQLVYSSQAAYATTFWPDEPTVEPRHAGSTPSG